MYARVSAFKGSPESIDQALGEIDQIVQTLKGIKGSKGIYYLVDRKGGQSLAITLWESEEAMRASEEAANRIRQDSASTSGATIVSVDRYEVVVQP